MQNARILILSLRFGEGHYQAGEALTSVFKSEYPSQAVVSHLDFGSFFHKKIDYLMKKAYFNVITKTPEIWKFIYEKTAALTAESCRKFVYGLDSKNMLNHIREFRPDIIVNTHFISSGLLAEYKKRGLITASLATVVTDYLVHGVWIHSGIDLYLTGCGEAVKKLREGGIPAERIMLTGIPIRPSFTRLLPKNEARQRLQLDMNRTTVLIMGGTGGIAGKNSGIVDLLEDITNQHSVQFLVVCGNDEDLYQGLRYEVNKRGFSTHIYRYEKDIEVFMAAADLLITKGGALTISEALTVGLPLLIYKPIPGHENGNAQFVEKIGAGIKVDSLKELQSAVKELIHHQHQLQQMEIKAKTALQTNTALLTAESILDLAKREKSEKYGNQAII
ncbi:MAG: Processive diacylglycerol beta-glucosyltransferase [Candidatus Dichloromethanomonas elyunquensis]|nr:MAG: Processive diacylglycerol beta-glucosyltransferase [Candidatus Dichloromethanomonas elyunquensis]